MKYTLLTSKGKIFVFTVKAAADTFQKAYGGVIFDSQIFSKDTQNV
jgi:hypothetical protein